MMQVQCGGCSKRYSVPETFAGKKMRCKQCQTVIAIPAAPPAMEEEPMLAPPPEAPVEPEPPALPAATAAGVPKAPGKKFGSFGPGAKKSPPGLKKPAGGKPGFRPPAKKPAASAGAAPAADAGEVDPVAARDARGRSRRAELGEEAPSRSKLPLILGGVVAAAVLIFAVLYFGGFLDGSKKPVAKSNKPSATADKDAKEADTAKAAAVAGKKDEKKEEADEEPDTEASPGSVEPLDRIPKDVGLVIKVAAGRVFNHPALKDMIAAKVAEDPDSKVFAEGGFDPMRDLKTLWVALPLTEGLSQGQPPEEAVLVFEAVMDREKLVATLQKGGQLSGTSKKIGSHDVFDAQSGGESQASVAFVSDEQVVFGKGATFEKALAAKPADSVRSHTVLKNVSGDFAADSLVWLAAAPPAKVVEEALANPQLTMLFGEGPRPKIDGVFLAVAEGADGSGLQIDLSALCGSPADAKRVTAVFGGLKMMVPPPMQPLLTGLKVAKAEGNKAAVSLALSQEALDGLKGMVAAQMGAPPPAPGDEPTDPTAEPADGDTEKPETTTEEPAVEPEKESTEETPAEPEETKDAAPDDAEKTDEAKDAEPEKAEESKEEAPVEEPEEK